jgi:hypothetical protein
MCTKTFRARFDNLLASLSFLHISTAAVTSTLHYHTLFLGLAKGYGLSTMFVVSLPRLLKDEINEFEPVEFGIREVVVHIYWHISATSFLHYIHGLNLLKHHQHLLLANSLICEESILSFGSLRLQKL